MEKKIFANYHRYMSEYGLTECELGSMLLRGLIPDNEIKRDDLGEVMINIAFDPSKIENPALKKKGAGKKKTIEIDGVIYYSAKTLCDKHNVEYNKVLNLVKDGKIKHLQISRAYYISEEEFLKRATDLGLI
jgi:hypothetical protein